MNNMNFDENTINKLKDMMNKGELNDVISQIPPEMIQNFSSMMSSNSSSNNKNENNNSNNNNNNNDINNANSNTSNNNFDFSNIDMNTILKMQSIMSKMNNSNDPRSNLLYSLKPYLREERKAKVEQYANLLNVAKIAELFNNTNNNSSQNMNNNNNNREGNHK